MRQPEFSVIVRKVTQSHFLIVLVTFFKKPVFYMTYLNILYYVAVTVNVIR